MTHRRFTSRRSFLGIVAGLVVAMPAVADDPPPRTIIVFAAASLTDVMREIGAAYQAETGVETLFSFAASSALARQIESGAPAAAYVSADLEWMDYLANRGLVDAGTRRNVAGNELVLIAPADSTAKIDIAPGFDLARALGGGRLAVADPVAVPAGRYAKAALTALGAWTQAEPRLAPAENVRAALALVSRGEAPLGIVYPTDARVDPGVRVVATFPAGSHAPILYPAAAIGASAGGADFVAYLAGDKAQAIFRKAGFSAAPGQPRVPAQAGTRSMH